MQKKKKVLSLVFLAVMSVLLIVWLIGSNQLVEYLAKGSSTVSVVENMELLRQDTVRYAFTSIDVSADMLGPSVIANGHVFVDTQLPSENKEAGFLLVKYPQKDLVYRMPGMLLPQSLVNDYPGANFGGDMNGLLVDSSLLNVKPGTYRIYIYCRENGANYGLNHTAYYVDVMANETRLHTFEPQKSCVAPDAVETSNAVVSAVDRASCSNGQFSLFGWATLAEIDEGTSTYVQFVHRADAEPVYSSLFSTEQYERIIDYGSGFVYQNAGYNVAIPVEQIDIPLNDEVNYRIVIEKDGCYYTNGSVGQCSIQ